MSKVKHYPKALSLVLLMSNIAVLAGCGQAGDLYLPDEKQEAYASSKKTDQIIKKPLDNVVNKSQKKNAQQ